MSRLSFFRKRSGASGKSPQNIIKISASAALLFVSACSEGGSGASSNPGAGAPPPPPPSTPTGLIITSEAEAGRFLTQTTFGPTESEIVALNGAEASQWFLDQMSATPSFTLPFVRNYRLQEEARNPTNSEFPISQSPGMAFWRNSIMGQDQLRQRMAFALSQILVVSDASDQLQNPEGFAYYQDILISNAFGNYRDVLEEVTYSPAMGAYLTYLQNLPGDATTGRVPDENYAREIMQLFSIGLVELDSTGEPVIGAGGNPVETYTNDDITGLARVFTGLSLNAQNFFFDFNSLPDDALFSPMVMFDNFHSSLEKSFLGTTIPANTNGTNSIDMALDTIFNHPNVGPFLSRQLIQRFVTSDPSPAYVGRVAAAFNTGSYTLPNGDIAGTGNRGDLAATLAAVIFDDDARNTAVSDGDQFGKIREPILRFTHWARAFEANPITPEFTIALWDTSSANELAQHPYRSPSVFNFYRPGYIAAGTETGTAGLTAPELQLVNANSVSGYANFISFFAFGADEFAGDNEFVDAVDANASFDTAIPTEIALATDPPALVDRLDRILTYGRLSATTRADIIAVTENIPLTLSFDPDYDGASLRARTAIVMVLTSTDYLVQR